MGVSFDNEFDIVHLTLDSSRNVKSRRSSFMSLRHPSSHTNQRHGPLGTLLDGTPLQTVTGGWGTAREIVTSPTISNFSRNLDVRVGLEGVDSTREGPSCHTVPLVTRGVQDTK